MRYKNITIFLFKFQLVPLSLGFFSIFFLSSKIFSTAASPSRCLCSARFVLNVCLGHLKSFLWLTKCCNCSLIAGIIRILN